MSSFNKISICGYLGRDPELRHTNTGDPVCDFSVATTERRKDKAGEAQELTTWFKVTFFGKRAELAQQYLSKGKRVFIDGSLTRQDWPDQEGRTHVTLEVRGNDLRFLDPVSRRNRKRHKLQPQQVTLEREVPPSYPMMISPFNPRPSPINQFLPVCRE